MRLLTIVPGAIWTVGFVAAEMLLPEVRALVTTGNFRERPEPVTVASEA